MNLKFGYGLLLVVLLLILPIFGHLDHMPLQAWDEARLATNALEMKQSGNWLVTTYNNEPDMWSTKPPLAIWLQVISTSILGYGELGSRLPSALAAMLTCLLLFWFVARKLKQTWLGVFAVLVLITSEGYVVTHGIRTADYDALLVLFTTAYTIFFFWYLEVGHRKWLLLFFVAMTLAVLTKGVAGMLLTPALMIYALFRKQTWRMFKAPAFYIGLAVFLAVTLGYYFLREHYNPGYIAAVKANELGGRYLNALERHEEDNSVYFLAIINEQLSYWYLLVPCGIAVGLAARDKQLQRFTGIISLSTFSFLLIISTAATKNRWYTLPMFPFMAILAGLTLWLVFNALLSMDFWKSHQKINLLPFIVILIIGLIPYQKTLNYISNPVPEPGMDNSVNIGYFLQANLRGERRDTAVRLLMDGEDQNINFYRKALLTKGINVIWTGFRDIKPGQLILPYDAEKYEILNTYFYNHKADQFPTVALYSVDSVKKELPPHE